MNKNRLLLSAFGLAGQFGFLIALPLISLGLLGKWMDTRLQTKHWVIVGVFTSLIFSAVLVGRKLMLIKRGMERKDE